MSLGWAINPDIQAANNQYSVMIAQDAGANTPYTRFDDTHAATSMTNNGVGAAAEITDFIPSGFEITTRLANAQTSPDEKIGFLALDFGDSPEVYSVERNSRTSADDDVESGGSFEPNFLFIQPKVVSSGLVNIQYAIPSAKKFLHRSTSDNLSG